MKTWTKIGVTVAGIVVLGAGASAGYNNYHESSNLEATPSSIVVSSSSSHKASVKKQASSQAKASVSQASSQVSQVAVAPASSAAQVSSSQSFVPPVVQSTTTKKVSQTSEVSRVARASQTSQVQASSQSSASSSSVETPAVDMVAQAIQKTSQTSGIDAQYLMGMPSGDLIQVRENHEKMQAAGMNVDPAVDPVIASYLVENGQLTPLQ